MDNKISTWDLLKNDKSFWIGMGYVAAIVLFIVVMNVAYGASVYVMP